MTDTTITVSAQVENLEEVKELRKELEKIKELKKEIRKIDEEDKPVDLPDIGDPNPNPYDPFKPEKTPKKPRFWVTLNSEGETEEFNPYSDEEDFTVETSFEI